MLSILLKLLLPHNVVYAVTTTFSHYYLYIATMRYLRSVCITLLMSIATLSFADTAYSLSKQTQGLGVIWGFDFLNDTTLVMTRKSGGIYTLNLSTGMKTEYQLPFDNLYANGQGGLLDIQLHPNGYLYMTSSRIYENGINTVLSRFKINSSAITHFSDIFVTTTLEEGGRHFGSRIAFDNKYIYFSVGDRGNRESAQDLSVHNGSIIRLYPDGTIPSDNPDFSNNGVYSYGHRNPQGLFYDVSADTLWSIEHGPRGGDELNIVKKGKNYGWPVISYGKEYWAPLSVGEGTHKEGMEQPLYQFTPSIAPSDLLVYRANNEHNGKVISSALKLRHLNVLTTQNGQVVDEERLLEELGERIRSIRQYKESIYLTTDLGNLYQLDFK